METWFLILIALCVSFLLKSLLSLFLPTSISKPKAPPGPHYIPIIGTLLFLLKSFSELEPIIRKLQAKHRLIISLRFGFRSAIFIGDRSLAHQALIQNGAMFADRPRALATNEYVNSNQHNISSAGYDLIWCLLRRNVTFEILHPSRVKSYGNARKWVLDILVNRLKTDSQSQSECGGGGDVRVVDHFQYAMFCLLVLMFFSDKLNEEQIKEIERVQRQKRCSGGTLRCDEYVTLRKVGDASHKGGGGSDTQQIVIEGPLCEDYYKIREYLYS